MRNAILILVAMIASCATQPQQPQVNTFNPEKKVEIKVIPIDSILYSMVIINKVDSLTFEEVTTNFMTLIENQPDTIILKDLTSSFNSFAGYDYSIYRYNKINQQLGGQWILKGTELIDTITLDSTNFSFKFPNLLAVSYNNTWIYFAMNPASDIGTGTYNDNVVKITR